MLDAFIIEQIRRREQKDERLQPQLEIPGRFPMQQPPSWTPEREREHGRHDQDSDDDNRGVIILDM